MLKGTHCTNTIIHFQFLVSFYRLFAHVVVYSQERLPKQQHRLWLVVISGTISMAESSWSTSLFKRMGHCSKTSVYWKSRDFRKIESRNRNGLLVRYCKKKKKKINLDQTQSNLFQAATKHWQKKVANQFRWLAQQINKWSP